MTPKPEMSYEDTLKAFENNYNYFQNNWQKILEQHKDLEGKAVAIQNEQIVASGDSKDSLMSRIYEEFENVGIYVTILEEPKQERPKRMGPRFRVIKD